MDRWLKSHRIGLVAYAIDALPFSARYSLDLEEHLSSYIMVEPGPGPNDRKSFLLTLPPSVLNILAHTIAPANEDKILDLLVLSSEIREVLEKLSPANKESDLSSVLGKTQIWGYDALYGYSDPKRLIWLGKALFGKKTWNELEGNTEIHDRLCSTLQTLRDPWTPILGRCDAIRQLTEALDGVPHWAQIENFLYHSQFCWPLLVLGNKDTLSQMPNASTELAVSLPIAVDLVFDGYDDVYLDPPGAAGVLSVEEWREHIRRDLNVAKDLWRAKHGNYGNTFKNKILHASVVFDFNSALKIAEDLNYPGIGRIPLSEGSADAYFAQVILNRLLGWYSIPMSAMSGLIGDKTEEEALNYQFVPPSEKGLVKKLRYVFSSRAFERIVLPQGEKTERALQDCLVHYGMTQTSEVLFASRLHNVADIVQVQGWRRHRYIRCPEVAWGIHSDQLGRPGLLPIEEPRVQVVLQSLQENLSAVVTLDKTPPIVLASALWHINHTLRNEIDPTTPPPMLSWAFIRSLDREQDRRFWELLWKVMGMTPAAILALASPASKKEAVSRLANALNQFVPDTGKGYYRSPDIIVILGAQRFKTEEEESPAPGSRPFMVSPILRELSLPGRLRGPFDNLFSPLIGKTRIILLPTDEPIDSEENISIRGLNAADLEVLRTLAVFDFGFTQQSASLILSELDGAYKGLATRTVLERLVNEGVLREGQGQYHIPRNVRKQLRQEEGKNLAVLHYKAGLALAPYVIPGKEFPSLALDRAFNPEYVHEAEEHFRSADSLAKDMGDYKTRNVIRPAYHHLSLFMPMPSWGVVLQLLKAGRRPEYTYEMAQQILQSERTAGVTSHPTNLCNMAEAAAQWAKENENLRLKLRQEANSYFREALAQCEVFRREEGFDEEEGFNRLTVLTKYAVYLADQEPAHKEEIARLSKEALDLLEKGEDPRGAKGEWLEVVADLEPSHRKAFHLYKLGFKLKWAQLLIKGIGAASLGGLREEVKAIRNDLSRDTAAVLLFRVASNRRMSKRQLQERVTDRWKEGLRLFDEFWGGDREVHSSLVQVRRVHVQLRW